MSTARVPLEYTGTCAASTNTGDLSTIAARHGIPPSGMELAWVKQVSRALPAFGLAARLFVCVCLFGCLMLFTFGSGRSHAVGSAGAVRVVPFAFCLFVCCSPAFGLGRLPVYRKRGPPLAWGTLEYSHWAAPRGNALSAGVAAVQPAAVGRRVL